MELLLELLRGRDSVRAIDEAEWHAMLLLAEEERVASWIAAVLRSQKAPLPPAIAKRLDQIERDATIAAFIRTSELKGVLRAFHREDLMVVPLKGPALAERLYGSASLRVSRDLDLLVHHADLLRAEALLNAIGFTPGSADDYHRPWYRGTTKVELHHNVENPLAFDFGVEGALGKARPAFFDGEPCWRLDPGDELLFLCLHAARHRFERLSLVLDLKLGFEKLPSITRQGKPRPEVAELGYLVTLGLAMVSHLQPSISVDIDIRTSKRQGRHLEKLADRLWHRLLTQSLEPRNWRTLHAFFLEIELPGWQRIHRHYRHLKILASRVIEPDFTFAAKLGVHRLWQVRILRPLRLISDSIRH
jgi:hypothetical protein